MKIFGHRGASRYMPENTLQSFEKAIELGADGVEFDVQLTKDGEIVVVHDEKIDRVSTGTGAVYDYTLQELRNFNFNKCGKSPCHYMPVPTLYQVMELLITANVEINIELKTGIYFYKDIEQKTLETIRKFNVLERIIFSSFNHYSVQKIKQLEPDARTALLCGGGVLVTGEQCKKVNAYALHPNTVQMRYPGFIDDCHRNGVKIHVWTVDSEVDFEYAKEHKVDGIFVNDLIKYRN